MAEARFVIRDTVPAYVAKGYNWLAPPFTMPEGYEACDMLLLVAPTSLLAFVEVVATCLKRCTVAMWGLVPIIIPEAVAGVTVDEWKLEHRVTTAWPAGRIEAAVAALIVAVFAVRVAAAALRSYRGCGSPPCPDIWVRASASSPIRRRLMR